jgi:hypothetical protein
MRIGIIKYLKAFCILYLSLNLFNGSTARAQITLKDEAIGLKSPTFYVAQVIDERRAGGPAVAFSQYLERNLDIDKSRWPIIIQIKDLKITETKAADGRIEGEIRLLMAFGLEKAYGFEHLLDYPGRLRFARSADNPASIERNLRSMIKGGLVYLNDWILANAQTSVKLAKSVKISFDDYSEKVEGDTIYYSTKRPLTWADFQSALRLTGPYQASVMPSIGYTQEAKVEQGVVLVKLLVKAYVPKSACWASAGGRDDYALNHEQRHFDIVKIIAEQFKRKMMAKKLTPDNYEAAINMQYLDCFRDMNTMQKEYDAETAHGQNRVLQDQWNSRIDSELKLTRQ